MGIFEKHIEDLARRSFEKGYTTYSEFLTLEEQSTVKNLKLPLNYTSFGGYNEAERRVLAFGENGEFPIVCIEIKSLNQKFADKLTHRDFLGAIMNLGINRNTLGDIIVKENSACIFALESISGYITQNLTRIKHTSVKCEIIDSVPDFINELPDEEEIIVSSLRADAVIASVYKLSRNNVSSLFSTSKVFINSALCTKESTQLKSKDRISVRGYGKYIFEEEIRKTKKDRLVIAVRIYK